MPKNTLIALGAGVLAALAATAFLSQAPGALMLVYFADLPLFMAGFAFGPQAVAIGGAAGFMAAGLIGGGHPRQPLGPWRTVSGGSVAGG